MRLRLRRFASAKWRAGRLAFRRHVTGHRRALIATLLVLAGGGLLLATLSGRHSDRTPGPSAGPLAGARCDRAPGTGAPRPAGPPAPPGEPVAPPEKPVPSARPPQEAALRPPPARPPPAPGKPAWLRFAVPAPPTGSRP